MGRVMPKLSMRYVWYPILLILVHVSGPKLLFLLIIFCDLKFVNILVLLCYEMDTHKKNSSFATVLQPHTYCSTLVFFFEKQKAIY